MDGTRRHAYRGVVCDFLAMPVRGDRESISAQAAKGSAIKHVYEVRPRKDKRGVDLISDALPFGRLWYCEVSDAIDYAKFRSRSHDADSLFTARP